MDSPPPPYALENGEPLFTWFRAMRDEHPVHHDPTTGVWSVYRHADVAAASSDFGTFSAELWRAYPPEWNKGDAWVQGRLTELDPPRHRQLRALISTAFTARTVANLAPRVEATVAKLLDTVADRDEFDFARALADPLPVMVIADLLGLPPEDRERLRGYAKGLLSFEAGELAGQELVAAIDKVGEELLDYLRSHYRRCRTSPDENLFSRLAAATVDGESLTEEEVVNLGKLLLIGGHVTTASALSSMVFSLVENPRAQAEVRADRALVPNVVEETVRLRPAVINGLRLTTRDTELADTTIPAKQFVSLSFMSANHDERHHTEPGRFDIHRQPNQHLGFGQGIHYCLGAPLARLEMRIALAALLDRFTSIEHAGPGEYYRNPSIAGLQRYPISVRRS